MGKDNPQLATMTAENETLKLANETNNRLLDERTEQLNKLDATAAHWLQKAHEYQAYAQQLREALEKIERLPYDEVPAHHQTIAMDALALPQDDTALRQWGAKLLREMADEAGAGSWDAISLRDKADELEASK